MVWLPYYVFYFIHLFVRAARNIVYNINIVDKLIHIGGHILDILSSELAPFIP